MMKEKTYDDIIDTVYPVKTSRPRMSMHDRAAQFSPFAALTGYEALIGETARLTDCRVELDETMKADLDMALAALRNEPDRAVSITYFRPDGRKEGGAYVTVSGKVKKIDAVERLILMADGTSVPVSDIVSLCLL